MRDLMRRLLGPAYRRLAAVGVNHPAVPKHYYGLDGLDRKVETFIDFDNGIFVEAGANDGETQSNTAYFARHRGWRGLLIEPIPDLAQRCRVTRPESVVENCALVPAGVDGRSVPMTYCGLLAVVDGGWGGPAEELAPVEIGRQSRCR